MVLPRSSRPRLWLEGRERCQPGCDKLEEAGGTARSWADSEKVCRWCLPPLAATAEGPRCPLRSRSSAPRSARGFRVSGAASSGASSFPMRARTINYIRQCATLGPLARIELTTPVALLFCSYMVFFLPTMSMHYARCNAAAPNVPPSALPPSWLACEL